MLTAVNGRSPGFFIARKWGRIETIDLITLEGGAKIRGWRNEGRGVKEDVEEEEING
jgi:hypothetical protein